MVILRDDKRIARLRSLSHVLRLSGLGVLLLGLILAFTGRTDLFTLQFLALLVGWILSQIAIYLDHRYVRTPRIDELLDEAVKKSNLKGRLYHYVLPAPHVLLTPAGPIILVAKYQGGQVALENGKWKQRGLGLRRFFGQEALGDPARDAQYQLGALARFLKKRAPDLEEVPIGVVIVFTNPNVELQVGDSPIPVVRVKKLKEFLRQTQNRPLPAAHQQRLQVALDAEAGPLAAPAGQS